MSALLAIWLLSALLATASVALFARFAGRPPAAPMRPPCVVLSPVKGSANLERYVAALRRQDYPDFRVVFAVESAGDPAYPVLAEASAQSGGRMTVVVAGLAEGRGQKVHNLAAALEATSTSDRIVVFSDADTEPPEDWLSVLTRPLALGRAPVSTGYIVMLPRAQNLATRLACAISLGVSTAFAPPSARLCSGASTAVMRDVLLRLDPAAFWAGVLSDDIALTRAARRAGLRIHANLAARVPSPVAFGWPELFAYARRQYMLLRIYAPKEWLIAAAALVLPPLGLASAVWATWQGRAEGVATALAILALQQLRMGLRKAALARILDAEAHAGLAPVFRLGRWAGPLVHGMHVLMFLTSLPGRTVRWARIVYRLDGPRRLRILSRR